jgi:beta-galactosidase
MQTDFKGLIKFKDTYNTNYSWKIYKLPIDNKILSWNKMSNIAPSPRLVKTKLNLNKIGDTYLNMTKFNRGYVWVNGNNLGRYSSAGPQQKLFCPGVWLQLG